MQFKKIIVAVVVLLSAIPATYAKKSAPKTEPQDSLSLAVGTSFGHDIAIQLERLRSLGIAVDLNTFLEAMGAQLRNQPGAFTPEEANEWLDRYIASTRPEELPNVLTPESQQAFIDSIASLPGAVRYPDGLVMIVELEGEGKMPTGDDTVRVMYSGRFYNGQEFDATTAPIEFPVNGVTPGFAEGLKQMRPGGRYRLIIPANLGYGEEGISGVIPGNAALDFTVDLLGIKP